MSTSDVITPVNSRDVRGTQITASFDLLKRGDAWIVPSQSSTKTYRVRLGKPHPTGIGTTRCIPFKSNTAGEGPDLWHRLSQLHVQSRGLP